MVVIFLLDMLLKQSYFCKKNVMKKLTLSFLLMVFVLKISANKSLLIEGVDVLKTQSGIYNTSDFRSQSISADITGHTLTIEFKEDVAKAHVIVRNNYGAIVAQETVISTPDVITFTINDAGHYRMEIILVNGDQYYGDFQVMN